MFCMFAAPYLYEVETEIVLGSCKRTIQKRCRSKQHAIKTATQRLRSEIKFKQLSFMKRLLAIFFFVPSLIFAQKDSVLSGAYNWQQPVVQKGKISSVVLLEGKVHDFEWMQFSANSIAGET